jgi:excinuclease UvrABC nuclease subunit
MFSSNYNVTFSGYWLDTNITGMPDSSGVYCVYACTYNAFANQVSLLRLLYIGEAVSVRERIQGHEKWSDWTRQISLGERLSFSTAGVTYPANRTRIEAALIFWHKPTCNTEYVNHFPFSNTVVSTSGTNALLDTQFTVSEQPQPLASLLRALGRTY